MISLETLPGKTGSSHLVGRTSSAILNRTGEDRHSCLVPDVSGRVRLFFFVYYFCVFGFGEFLWSYMWLVGS